MKKYKTPKEFWEKNPQESTIRLDGVYPLIHSLIPMDTGLRVLDVGCGIGRNIEFLAGMGFKSVCGVDISRNNIAHCEREWPSYGFERMDVLDGLPMSFDFDVVIVSEVLEHVDNPIFVLKECLRVGKVVVASLPNGFWTEIIRKKWHGWKNEIASPEYIHFTMAQLENLQRELGFIIKDKKYFYGRYKWARSLLPRHLASRFILKLTNGVER